MPTLYNITDDIKALDDLLEEAGGVVDDELIDVISEWFEQNEENLEEKLDGYGAVIRDSELESKKLAQEIKRLTARKKVADNKAKALKERLLWAMLHLEKPKIKTDKFSFSICINSVTPVVLKVEDAALLPHKFTRTVIEADMDAIRKALEDLEDPFGDNDESADVAMYARLGERGKHLRMK